jgi:hypothetical protein
MKEPIIWFSVDVTSQHLKVTFLLDGSSIFIRYFFSFFVGSLCEVMRLVEGITKSGFAWDSNAFVLGHYDTQTSIIIWAISISQLLIIPYNNILTTNVVQLCTLLFNCVFINVKEMEFVSWGVHISHAWIIIIFLEFILNISCSNSPHHLLEMSQWYNGHHPQQRLRKKYLPLLKFLMNCFILPWVSFCHMIYGLCISSHVTKKCTMNSHDQNYMKNKLWSLTKSKGY